VERLEKKPSSAERHSSNRTVAQGASDMQIEYILFFVELSIVIFACCAGARDL
jgi:hypothetical protein